MTHHRTYTPTIGAITVAVALAPALALAQSYDPLVKIPGLTFSGDFAAYFNSLFEVVLLVGAILAVIIIAASGLQYMTTDAIFQKKDAVKKIQYAVIGLLMLLGTYLVFNQIDPDIVNNINIRL